MKLWFLKCIYRHIQQFKWYITKEDNRRTVILNHIERDVSVSRE